MKGPEFLLGSWVYAAFTGSRDVDAGIINDDMILYCLYGATQMEGEVILVILQGHRVP